MNTFGQKLDEWEALRKEEQESTIGLPNAESVYAKRLLKLEKEIIDWGFRAMATITGINTDLRARFHGSIDPVFTQWLSAAFEEMRNTKKFSFELMEMIFTVQELLVACLDRMNNPLEEPDDEDRREEWKWKGRAAQHPGHRSQTNSAAEEGWTVGGFVDTGPHLMRGTKRPSSKGGL